MPTTDALRRSRSTDRFNLVEAGQELRYPRNHGEWVDRYTWLHDAYVGDPYDLATIKGLHLFRALDDSGEIIAETRRLTRDVQHVVDTDARAVTAGRLTLDPEDGLSPVAERAAYDIWARSAANRKMGAWTRMAASMGDMMWEVRRDNGSAFGPQGVRIIGYDPREVRLEYDTTAGGVELSRAIVTIQYFDDADVSPDGMVTEGAVLNVYQRILTTEEVIVTRNGQPVERESGPHGLGRVPMVHVPFIPYAEPEHGLWAAQGLEGALAYTDSLMTQVLAIGNRHGNPILAIKGAKLGADSDILKLGRVVSGMPADASIEYVEAGAEAVRVLLEAARQEREAARETLPEFLFTGAGAQASGDALRYRSAAFVAKMTEVRARFYGAFRDALAMGIAMEERREYDPEAPSMRVAGGPILPPDVGAELDALEIARVGGGLKRVDYVRHLQRLGLVPDDADPEAYAAEVMDEQADRAALFFGSEGGEE